MMRMSFSDLEPLLASSLLHLAWPKQRQIDYLKEIGFRKFDDDKLPTDELIFEFYHAVSGIRSGVERGVLSRDNYERLLNLENVLVAMEETPELWVSRELDAKPWQDIRLLASDIASNLGLDVTA